MDKDPKSFLNLTHAIDTGKYANGAQVLQKEPLIN